MSRTVIDLVLLPQLRHLPEVHHTDAIGDVTDHGEVVRDEDVCQAQFLLELLHEVDDLGLHRDVQGRYRLVADQHLGVERDTARNPDALPLTTRELVGVAVDVLGVEADQLQELLDTRPALVIG